ncbi:MAG: LptF/LptG family permease [Chlamydiota bacterium]
MICNTVWKRYLFSEILKVITLFTISFYLFYILIDYSLHANHFAKIHTFRYVDIFYYYFYLIIKRLDIVLPLALVIALNKVLLKLNQNNELISLTVAGLNPKRILMPFFIIASVISMLIFLNFECCIPRSLDYLENFENQYFKKKSLKNYAKRSAYSLALPNGNQLIFACYHDKDQIFEDVFYLCDKNEVWKMKTLSLQTNQPEGCFVDHLVKDSKNLLIQKASYEKKVFPNLVVDFSIRKKTTLPFEHQSLSSLYSLIKTNNSLYQTHASKIKTQLYMKLFTPFISFLAILAISPFCMIFSRRLPILLLYGMSIFGLITFFMILDAAVILGENNYFPPLIAVATPFICGLLGFGKNFIKNNAN